MGKYLPCFKHATNTLFTHAILLPAFRILWEINSDLTTVKDRRQQWGLQLRSDQARVGSVRFSPGNLDLEQTR